MRLGREIEHLRQQEVKMLIDKNPPTFLKMVVRDVKNP